MPAPRWRRAVAASAAIVIAVVVSIGVAWLATARSKTARYLVSGAVSRIELSISSGQAVIVGTQSSTIEVRRTDHYAFGHAARERRLLTRGVLQITSSCPKIVVGTCSASYELAVPETVAVSVRTRDGGVRLTGFRGAADVRTVGGAVSVEAYCGFDLAARTQSGDVRIAAACSPAHLEVLTRDGNAIAQVPPGRYRVSASSGGGEAHVSGLVRDPRAPFTIDIHSGSGSVTIGGGL